MGKVQQRVLALLALSLAAANDSHARKFYDDDPLWKVPRPMNVESATNRKLSEHYDYFYNTFGKPGEHHASNAIIPARAINTLGEVPDSSWFVNRHGSRRLTTEELLRGPGNTNAPSTDTDWKVVAAKSEGITPGLTIIDGKNRRYLLKFDSLQSPEIASAADVIGTKFFHALGYYTPENYIVYFNAERLAVDPKAKLVDRRGIERPMRQSDIEGVLAKVPRDSRGRYRAVASLYLSGKPVGPFRYHGTRTDDPNDTVPHEHRRDLRGLYVFSAWLNHTDTKSINSLDMLVEEDGIKYIRHHLIDFGAILGSDSFIAKSPRGGYVPLFDWKSSAAAFFSLGMYVPRWARAEFPHVKGVGRIESEVFDPRHWYSNYFNPAFENCLPDDAYWAAKKVLAFTDDDIRVIVRSGELSDKQAEDHLIRALIERRDKIGRAFLDVVMPLDNFRIENGSLAFDDLAVRHGFRQARPHQFRWFDFDNERETRTPIAGSAASVPSSRSAYLAADIWSDDERKRVTVYLRNRGGQYSVVGIERTFIITGDPLQRDHRFAEQPSPPAGESTRARTQ